MQFVTNFGVRYISMTHTNFKTADKPFVFRNKTLLKVFIDGIFKKEKKTLDSLTYVFCTDAYLLNINRSFLNHDYYTDIISFDLSENPKSIIGEIYISLDRIKDNAQKLKTGVKEETLRVIFHGALHLCGYKDKSPSDIKQMRAKENHYLSLYAAQST